MKTGIWKMLLSKQGFYTDFEWFTGLSNLPATKGTWTLNQDPNNPNRILSIEWNRNTQDNTADIDYTNIKPASAENGSYIHYGITNEVQYNAFYDIFSQSRNNHTDIEWLRDDHIGRVNDPLHFGNNDRQCWNGMLMDDTCP